MNWFEKKTLGLFVKTNGLFSKPLYSGLGNIFMLHRILPEEIRNQYPINKDLAITPAYLDFVFDHLKKRGCTFVSMDELSDIILKKKAAKKIIAFTLDDGYKDNIEFGLPVFEKYNVPFTIYVTNCFPNNTAILWWYLLESHLLNAKELLIETSVTNKYYKWASQEEGLHLYSKITETIKQIPFPEFREVIKKSFHITEEQLNAQAAESALSWDELKAAFRHPLVTIGAHTMDHYPLKNLTEAEAFDQISRSKKQLMQKLGIDVKHFAYPYGGFKNVAAKDIEACKHNGFTSAVINYPGNISYNHSNSMQCLPRMSLGNSTTTEKLEWMLNGVLHFSFNGFNYQQYQQFK